MQNALFRLNEAAQNLSSTADASGRSAKAEFVRFVTKFGLHYHQWLRVGTRLTFLESFTNLTAAAAAAAEAKDREASSSPGRRRRQCVRGMSFAAVTLKILDRIDRNFMLSNSFLSRTCH